MTENAEQEVLYIVTYRFTCDHLPQIPEFYKQYTYSFSENSAAKRIPK